MLRKKKAALKGRGRRVEYHEAERKRSSCAALEESDRKSIEAKTASRSQLGTKSTQFAKYEFNSDVFVH